MMSYSVEVPWIARNWPAYLMMRNGWLLIFGQRMGMFILRKARLSGSMLARLNRHTTSPDLCWLIASVRAYFAFSVLCAYLGVVGRRRGLRGAGLLAPPVVEAVDLLLPLFADDCWWRLFLPVGLWPRALSAER